MPHYLIAQSELPAERAGRRRRAGRSSGETYAATLEQMQPGIRTTIISPADAEGAVPTDDWIAQFDAVFLTGSPMHVYDDTPEVRRQLDFMRRVFDAGVPSFGSCAGLQIATVAAGGAVRRMPQRMEAGIARRIVATGKGRHHPLLAGRAASWDAPAIHGDEVCELPPGATLLASNAVTTVQAAEIRFGKGVFWGVQYHPELALQEIAIALRAQKRDLIEAGLARTESDVGDRADEIEALHNDPYCRALRWRLGVDGELADEKSRRREIANFLESLPVVAGRG